MNIRKKIFAVYLLCIFVTFMLCGGCATEIVLKIREGIPYMGNKIFHAAAGAACIALTARLVQVMRI